MFGALAANSPEVKKAMEEARQEAKRNQAKPGGKGESSDPAKTPRVKVTATSISDDYGTNQIAADAKWKGKDVVVTGKIDNIGKDMFDNAFVTLSDGKEFSLGGVHAIFPKEAEAEIAKLRKGQTISLAGRCEGIGATMIDLKDPTIVQ